MTIAELRVELEKVTDSFTALADKAEGPRAASFYAAVGMTLANASDLVDVAERLVADHPHFEVPS